MIASDFLTGGDGADVSSSFVPKVEDTAQSSDTFRREFNVPRVPGSSAGPGVYVGRKLFNSALRYLLNSSSGLGMFARSSFGFSERYECSTERNFQFLCLILRLEKRLGKADTVEVSRKKMLTAVIVGLNYLHLNRPTSAPASVRLGRALSRTQWGIVRRVELFMDAWLKHDDVGPTDMGRTAPKVECIEEMICLLTDQARKVIASTNRSYFPAGREDELTGCSNSRGGGRCWTA